MRLKMVDADTLIGLVKQYSPSGCEKPAVDWLVERMQQVGFSNAFADDAGNAVGIMGSGERQIVLLGHIDTVPGEIPVREADGFLFGRGTVDAKAPLACFVDAVSQIGPLDNWQFVVIGAIDEERDSVGARFIIHEYAPDFAIVGEPNHWDRVSLGYKGSASANLMVTHAKVHSAHADETACERAVNLWLRVKEFAEKFNVKRGKIIDQLIVSLSSFESGEGSFDQWARLKIGARLPLDVPPQEYYELLQELLKEVNVQPIGYAIPAWKCEKNTPLVRALLAAIRSEGGTPSFVYKTGTADLNIVAPVWNCPMAVYGPGDSALDHSPHEKIDLNDYEKSVKVLVGTIKNLVSNAG